MQFGGAYRRHLFVHDQSDPGLQERFRRNFNAEYRNHGAAGPCGSTLANQRSVVCHLVAGFRAGAAGGWNWRKAVAEAPPSDQPASGWILCVRLVPGGLRIKQQEHHYNRRNSRGRLHHHGNRRFRLGYTDHDAGVGGSVRVRGCGWGKTRRARRMLPKKTKTLPCWHGRVIEKKSTPNRQLLPGGPAVRAAGAERDWEADPRPGSCTAARDN
jgi:hypothetical protein